MNSFTLFNALAVSALVSLSACSASEAQQVRQVNSFETVKVSGAVDLYLRQGSTTEVKVDAAPEVLEYIKTEVSGNTLTIYRDKKFSLSDLMRNKPVKVYVTTPKLSGIEVSGACDVKGETPIKSDDFRISASGASDVTLTLNANSVSTDASGASDIRLDGRVERQRVQISGSSDYRASDLRSDKANINASGASDAYVYVDEELSSHSSGASDIRNKGKAHSSR
ncbi:head GIN domain-containing protein [uncultured Hymenobacter sp.]|uniref:head GIN domain-containing protein n=1 Tax=uncultured Hymenobacter sp. TaxID=170016 RepID=UPI0035C9AAA6